MAYPASTLVPLSFRTCSILLATIQRTLRILRRAEAEQVVYFHTLGGSETVSIAS